MELLNRSKTSIVASFSAFRFQQGARGRIDGTGQRRHIYVFVQTYLHFSGFSDMGRGSTKEHPCRFFSFTCRVVAISACVFWFDFILSCTVLQQWHFLFSQESLSCQVSRAVSARKMRSNFTSRLAILSKYVCVCMCEKWGSTNNYAGCNEI